MAVSRIAELASLIATSTSEIDTFLTLKGLPKPSFSADYSADSLYDDRISASRQAALEATDELHSLILGPVGALTSPSVRNMFSREDHVVVTDATVIANSTIFSLVSKQSIDTTLPLVSQLAKRRHSKKLPQNQVSANHRSVEFCAML